MNFQNDSRVRYPFLRCLKLYIYTHAKFVNVLKLLYEIRLVVSKSVIDNEILNSFDYV